MTGFAHEGFQEFREIIRRLEMQCRLQHTAILLHQTGCNAVSSKRGNAMCTIDCMAAAHPHLLASTR